MTGRQPRVRALGAGLVALVVLAVLVGGCGYNVELPDLFALTRTGPGGKLTMVVNESGQITCAGRQKTLTSSQIITARDLAQNLVTDAGRKLTIPPLPGSVYYYRVKLQQGTIAFPDRAGTNHRYLGQVEAFALQAAAQYCG